MSRNLAVLLLLLGTGCAPAGLPGEAPRGRNDRITMTEVRETQLPYLWDVVQRLRPSWIASPPPGGGSIGVFLDGSRVGDDTFLRQIPASQVSEVRYVNARQIRAELTRHQSEGLYSAILVTSLRM